MGGRAQDSRPGPRKLSPQDQGPDCGTGYAVASLEAALWCLHTTDSFEAAVLAAVNLGEDADATGAITGQLAGAVYGIDAVPMSWRQTLHMGVEIEALAERIHDSFAGRS